VIVIADGLSALAVMRHAVPLLRGLAAAASAISKIWHRSSWPSRHASRWAMRSVNSGSARQVVVLIGERPG
jgi:ethanolamine ammonia-lyase small subunit